MSTSIFVDICHGGKAFSQGASPDASPENAFGESQNLFGALPAAFRSEPSLSVTSIGYEFADAKHIDAYSVDVPDERGAPTQWTLKASKDGTDYEVLDSQANLTWGPDIHPMEKRFVLGASAQPGFRFFMLEVPASEDGVAILRIQLLQARGLKLEMIPTGEKEENFNDEHYEEVASLTRTVLTSRDQDGKKDKKKKKKEALPILPEPHDVDISIIKEELDLLHKDGFGSSCQENEAWVCEGKLLQRRLQTRTQDAWNLEFLKAFCKARFDEESKLHVIDAPQGSGSSFSISCVGWGVTFAPPRALPPHIRATICEKLISWIPDWDTARELKLTSSYDLAHFLYSSTITAVLVDPNSFRKGDIYAFIPELFTSRRLGRRKHSERQLLVPFQFSDDCAKLERAGSGNWEELRVFLEKELCSEQLCSKNGIYLHTLYKRLENRHGYCIKPQMFGYSKLKDLLRDPQLSDVLVVEEKGTTAWIVPPDGDDSTSCGSSTPGTSSPTSFGRRSSIPILPDGVEVSGSYLQNDEIHDKDLCGAARLSLAELVFSDAVVESHLEAEHRAKMTANSFANPSLPYLQAHSERWPYPAEVAELPAPVSWYPVSPMQSGIEPPSSNFLYPIQGVEMYGYDDCNRYSPDTAYDEDGAYETDDGF